MEENMNTTVITMEQTDRPQPRGDVDDLIFRGEGWLASDR